MENYTETATKELKDIANNYATVYTTGLKRAADASKTTLDMVAEQNSEFLSTWKQAFKGSTMPGLFLFDLAGQAFEGYVALQKNLLDLAVEQSTAVVKAVQEFKQNPEEAKDGITNIFQGSLNRGITAQKSVLDFAAKQSKAVSDAVMDQEKQVS
jgi:hypothetical protein